MGGRAPATVATAGRRPPLEAAVGLLACALALGGCDPAASARSAGSSSTAPGPTEAPRLSASPIPVATGGARANEPSPAIAGQLLVEAIDKTEAFDEPGSTSLSDPIGVGSGFAIVGTSTLDHKTTARAWLSPDGRTWERVSSIPVLDGAAIRDVAELPNGSLLAVGLVRPAGGAWTSADGGRTWHLLSIADGGLGNDFHRIAAGTGGVLLVGSGPSASRDKYEPRLWWSADGADWASVAMPAKVFGNVDIRDVAATSGGFVAVGGRAPAHPGSIAIPFDGWRRAAWTSKDGRTWTEASTPDEGLLLLKVYAGATGLLAFGYGADFRQLKAWISTDGLAWQVVPGVSELDGASFFVRDGRIWWLQDLFRQTGKRELQLQSSPDGLDWTTRGRGELPLEMGGGPVAAGVPGILEIGGYPGKPLWLIPWPEG